MNRRTGTAAAVGFVASVVLANWLTSRYGFVPVGFGLTATAGTYAAGFALALRDAVQDALGRIAVVVLIVIGAGLSAVLAEPVIAVASAAAFVVSELADFAVYTPLRDRNWSAAVVASNVVGAVVDTVVFVGLAFGAAAIWSAMPGQLVGKSYATVVYLALGLVIGRAVLRHGEHTKDS